MTCCLASAHHHQRQQRRRFHPLNHPPQAHLLTLPSMKIIVCCCARLLFWFILHRQPFFALWLDCSLHCPHHSPFLHLPQAKRPPQTRLLLRSLAVSLIFGLLSLPLFIALAHQDHSHGITAKCCCFEFLSQSLNFAPSVIRYGEFCPTHSLSRAQSLLTPFINTLFIFSNDAHLARVLKLQLLQLLFEQLFKLPAQSIASGAVLSVWNRLLSEFTSYARHPDTTFACASLQTLSNMVTAWRQHCGASADSAVMQCVQLLLSCLSSYRSAFVAQSVICLRQLLILSSSSSSSSTSVGSSSPLSSTSNHSDFRVPQPVLLRLVQLLQSSLPPPADASSIDSPVPQQSSFRVPLSSHAQQSILSILQVYRLDISDDLPDLLLSLCGAFAKLAVDMRVAILHFAVHCYLIHPQHCQLSLKYLMDLSRYDQHPVIRDQSRFWRLAMFRKKDEAVSDELQSVKDRIKSILSAPSVSSPPALPSLPATSTTGSASYAFESTTPLVYSLSHLIQQHFGTFTPLPSFPSIVPDPTVRQPKVVCEIEMFSTFFSHSFFLTDCGNFLTISFGFSCVAIASITANASSQRLELVGFIELR